MKNSNRLVFSFCLLFQLLVSKSEGQVIVFKENFDTVSAMIGRGWQTINKSNPLGIGEWMQGNNNVGANALSGNPSSYAQVDYTSTDAIGTTNTISDWLLTPPVLLENADSITFYTLSFNSAAYPDRLELRLSPMGSSDSVGVNDTTVGHFSTLVVSINPNLDFISFPSVTTDSSGWTKYKGYVTGLSGPTSCRLGFRYYVTNGGFAGANSSTIGIDSFLIVRFPPDLGINENDLNVGIKLYPNPARDNVNISISKSGNYQVDIYSVLGQKVQSFKTETSKNIEVSNLSKGLYTIRVIEIQSGKYKTVPFVKE